MDEPLQPHAMVPELEGLTVERNSILQKDVDGVEATST